MVVDLLGEIFRYVFPSAAVVKKRSALVGSVQRNSRKRSAFVLQHSCSRCDCRIRRAALTQQQGGWCSGGLQLRLSQLLCSLFHPSSSACGISTGRRRLPAARTRRRWVFIHVFRLHVHGCDVASPQMSLHGWRGRRKEGKSTRRKTSDGSFVCAGVGLGKVSSSQFISAHFSRKSGCGCDESRAAACWTQTEAAREVIF